MAIIIVKIMGIAVLGYSVLPSFCFRFMRLFRLSPTDKTIYLTFDDGPDPKFTAQLLDLLDEYRIKASFFVVAAFAQQNGDIVRRMRHSGHLINLHSLSHKNELIQSPESTKRDFENSIHIMNDLGVEIHYFRPPWGLLNLTAIKQLRKYKLRPFLWHVMVGDWRAHTSASRIADKLLKRTKSGDIICLHDGRGSNEAPSRTIEALRRVLPVWISDGYEFDTLDHYKREDVSI